MNVMKRLENTMKVKQFLGTVIIGHQCITEI